MLVYADLQNFVTDVRDQLGLKPKASIFRALFVEVMGRIFRLSEAHNTAWDNSGVGPQGNLSIIQGESGMGIQVVKLPPACVRVYRVEWQMSTGDTSNKLDLVNTADLDNEENGWRSGTATGVPSCCVVEGTRLVLDTAPAGVTTGKLVVRGFGIPDPDVALSLLPEDLQMGPAYFMLYRLPWSPDNDAHVAIHRQYRELWQGTPGAKDVPGMERQLIDAFRSRRDRSFNYR